MSTPNFSSPMSTCMTPVDFPVLGALPVLDDTTPSSDTVDAQWLAAVRARARKLYLQAKHKGVPPVRRRSGRWDLDTAEAGRDDEVDGEAASDSFVHPAADVAASVVRVSHLLDSLSLKIDCSVDSDDSVRSVDGSTFVASSTTLTLNSTSDGDGDAPPPPPSPPALPALPTFPDHLDWRQPDHLERFLDRCVGAWDVQLVLLDRHDKMQQALQRLCQRLVQAGEQMDLLAWYVRHLQGVTPSSASSSTTTVLKEAQMAVFAAAEVSMLAGDGADGGDSTGGEDSEGSADHADNDDSADGADSANGTDATDDTDTSKTP